ncbi:MAG: PP2C family serine/threonine-protein phosphatase [Pseudomonadota bacterium]
MTLGIDGMRYSAKTHIGSVRNLNEDAIISMPELGVWAVSDGMGGHAAGDFASHAVTGQLATLPPGLEPGQLMHATREAIFDAHIEIATEAHRRGGVTIGATVVALIVSGNHFVCFWVGDSRLYRLREGALEMMSTDHSLVAELVEAGQLTWAEAEKHPKANAITRAVGVGHELEIDKRRGDVMQDDKFLLCSDGLTRYADEDMLRHVLMTTPVETVCDRLIRVALAGGGADNISAIVVQIP